MDVHCPDKDGGSSGCVQKCKVPWILVPNDERQQEQGSRAKRSRVTCTFELSLGDYECKQLNKVYGCVKDSKVQLGIICSYSFVHISYR